MIVKVILPVIVILVFLAFLVAVAAMLFEDTETFRAIDEKVAKFIKGEEDDDE